MPSREDWIKLHTRDLQDPLLRRLTRDHRCIYYELQLLSKSFSEMRGYLVNRGQGMTEQDIALALGDELPAVRDALALCCEYGLLELTEHSGYRIVNWDTRQAAEIREPKDVVNARKAKQRAREKLERERLTPPQNVTRLRERL